MRSVLLIGWGGATPRQLRPYVRWYEAEGFAVEHYTLDMAKVLSARLIVEDLEQILARLERSSAPLLVHAFSNNGFCLYATLLDVDEGGVLRRRVAAHVFDSGPGIPRVMSRAQYVAHLQTGLFPKLSNARGLRGLQRVLVRLALSVPTHLFPEVGDRYRVARGHYAARAPQVPLLALGTSSDPLIDHDALADLLDQERARGVSVSSVDFPDSDHVLHFHYERDAYAAALREFFATTRLAPDGSDS